jgi:hypothetical protein
VDLKLISKTRQPLFQSINAFGCAYIHQSFAETSPFPARAAFASSLFQLEFAPDNN